MEQVVTWCLDCPLYDDSYNVCNHPKIDNWFNEPYHHNSNKIEMEGSGEDLSYIEVPITPDWCPLKKEPIVIHMIGSKEKYMDMVVKTSADNLNP